MGHSEKNELLNLDGFHPAVQSWFASAFAGPTPVQTLAWAAIGKQQNTLIAAPTGSGKTLAAFLSAIDALVLSAQQSPLPQRTRVLYVSPLKALSNDIHKNLDRPLTGITEVLEKEGLADHQIQAAVRTGDTPQSEREKMRRKPPHILVTTPESLFILLTSESGREMLSGVETVIVDEIHAMAGSKRGAHLLLSMARLDALCEKAPVRIGLSATQKPIESMARFLCGADDCQIVDTGYTRDRDLKLMVPDSPLTPVMANEVWEEIYDGLAGLVETHTTTLIFVNTRRHAERVARHLAERIGEDAVTSHHGSLAREHRLEAEQRLRSGDLRALVATASLELGIDIGDVDLVCQLGSPRSIAGFLQRVGRSGHAVEATPKGRLFPLTLDDLVECAALLDAVNRGELDVIVQPSQPLDVLAQQVIAEVACREWNETELHQLFASTWAYRDLSREQFAGVAAMLADGFSTRHGRRSAYLHRDVVNDRLRPRRSARLTALTNAGTIPDQFDYEVVLRPTDIRIGTLNEDFAFESLPGDIFQLGNASYRIARIESGKVFVEDAKGQPPTIPFWFGEAPGRTDELSDAVSRLRLEAQQELEKGPDSLRLWFKDQHGLHPSAAEQLADYLAKAHAALGVLPTRDHLVLERFFDETGDMHLVVHSTWGSRVNRALGLSLRKKFCRKFNFELQASALEDSLVLSLGPTHSFDLEEIIHYVRSDSAREVLIQALLQAPMFPTRWRWVACTSLAVRRRSAGERRPPQFQRNDAEDLVAVVFPEQLACQDNVVGPREIPDHPLVNQTIHDCLHEVMDIDGLVEMLQGIENGQIQVTARDLIQPSPMAEEILNARPYAFLDDGAAEERRTGAVKSRRDLTLEEAGNLSVLDPQAITQVREQAWIGARDADELHDGLVIAGFVSDDEIERGNPDIGSRDWRDLLENLVDDQRAVAISSPNGSVLWCARERLHQLLAIYPEQVDSGMPAALESLADPDVALVEVLRSRMEVLGPETLEGLTAQFGMAAGALELAMLSLEQEGNALSVEVSGQKHWCNRRLLARIHGHSLKRRRSYFKPVDAAAFMRFLFRWQGVTRPEAEGRGALEAVLKRLEGWSASVSVWENEILPARMYAYQGNWLDELCTSGRYTWLRVRPSDSGARQRSGVLSQTPIALLPREALGAWLGEEYAEDNLSSAAAKVLSAVRQHGASFASELQTDSGLLEAQLEQALAELAATGLLTADSFQGLRHLAANTRDRSRRQRHRRRGFPAPGLDEGGRWSLVRSRSAEKDHWQWVEYMATVLLRRYGVVFRALVYGQPGLPGWRDLLYVLRRMELREQVAGGRFVDGFTGEQFADPDAVRPLSRCRDIGADRPQDLTVVSAADPLNLSSVILPGDRVPATPGNRLAFRGGELVAILVAGEVKSIDGTALDWASRQKLLRVAGSRLQQAPDTPGTGLRPH
jgi:ATP-dependent Lhr-like helicase